MVTEEFVTTKIVNWLRQNGWTIVCYDFPQSGTGFALKPNNSTSKNKEIIIPDIVARKGDIGLLFENKDRFHLGDFNKIDKLRSSNDYEKSLELLFERNRPKIMYYGIAFPHFDYQIEKAKPHLNKIDFLITVTAEGTVRPAFNLQTVAF